MKMLPLVAAAALAVSTTVASADGHQDVGSASSIGGLNESSTLVIGGIGALVLIGLAAGLGGSSSGTN